MNLKVVDKRKLTRLPEQDYGVRERKVSAVIPRFLLGT